MKSIKISVVHVVMLCCIVYKAVDKKDNFGGVWDRENFTNDTKRTSVSYWLMSK